MRNKQFKQGFNIKPILVTLCITAFMLGNQAVQAAPWNTANSEHADQQNKITAKGYVKDANGQPIAGASIISKSDKGNGTITNHKGYYTLSVRPNTVLIVSFIGYKKAEIKASENSNITLYEDSELLEEVIVVGYGTQKKEHLTGSVTSVNLNETLGSRPITDVGRGLQGAVPGLSVTIPTGEVGSDPIMKIRGHVGSVAGDNRPLIIVDNVEVPSIQVINPDDIEEISVLKDAASASIYGAKAAFGVILITTKKGAKQERFNITYSTNFAWQDPTKKIRMAGVEGLEYTVDAHNNRGATMPAGGFWRVNDESLNKIKEWQNLYGKTVGNSDPVVYGRDWYYDGVNKYGYRIYDGAKHMINKWTPSQTHNVSVSGKSGKTSFNIGLGLISQKGLLKPAKRDDFKRYNASMNITSEISKYLTVRAGTILSDRTKRYPEAGTTTADPWLYTYRWSRLFPVGVTERGNPLRGPINDTANAFTAKMKNKYININLGATITPIKNFDIKFDYTYSNENNITKSAKPTLSGGEIWYSPVLWKDEEGQQVYVNEQGEQTDTGGTPAYMFPQTMYNDQSWISRTSGNVDQHIFNIYATYNLFLGSGKQHELKFMAGSNIVKKDWETNTAKKMDLINFENPQFSDAIGTETVNASTKWESQAGFFGRVNYAFSDRYLLEANLRYGGSSKFPRKLKWRLFPSFSGGWVISNEKFMKPVRKVMNFAKLRASWGTIGDQSVGNHLYYPKLNSYKTNWLDSKGERVWGYTTPNSVSRDITWQDIQTLNLGIDLQFLNNMFGATFDWFQRTTKNMIIDGDDLPHTHGTGAPKGNYGNLRTKGWEITLNFQHRFNNGLGINAMLSLSDAISKTTKGADYRLDKADRSITNTFATGKRYGDIYGYATDRLYQKDDFVWNEDGTIKKTWIIIDGIPKETNMLSGTNPVYQTYLEDGKQVILFSPGDVKYKDLNGDGYITPGSGTFGDPGDRKVIGNSTPRYEYGIRLGLDYKGFDFSIFLQGVGKRKIWGSGQLAIPGYNAKEGAMPRSIARNYWKEDRTDAFYPRAWDLGNSNTGYSMQIQSKYILDMSYLRVKNINLGYSLPNKILKKVFLEKARIYVSLENFFTSDKLRGLPIDPEAISGYSMFSSNYNLGRTGTSTPAFKSASFGVQLTF